MWAFSLASRRCCDAAAPQRFCQIVLSVADMAEFKTDLAGWTETLGLYDRGRHVRRLKVTGASKKTSQRQAEKEGDGSDEEDAHGRWTIRDAFPMHEFCLPPRDRARWFDLVDDTQAWQSLSRFIRQLPGLKDLVWACGPRMPAPVLSAIHAADCRLHMHGFRLRSLDRQHRDSPQPIDAHDWALASSPSLASVVASCTGFTSEGWLDYTTEAVVSMAAGTAPNLAHLWLVSENAGDSIALREAARLGKPPWQGFFPASPVADARPGLGRLKSMVFRGYPPYNFDRWGRATDLTRLRRLEMEWHPTSGRHLAKMAERGDFKSLDSLRLWSIEELDQQSLNRLMENLPPLQRLNLSGYFTAAAVDAILRRQGSTLRDLELDSRPRGPDDDGNPTTPNAIFSAFLVQRLVTSCPDLEELVLTIPRTRGDAAETAAYRALSRLRSLRRLHLRLVYTVEPENEDEWPEMDYFSSSGIPYDYIRDAMSNCAVDATLARAIFDVLSAHNDGLTYVRLEPERKIEHCNVPGASLCNFQDMLRWFARHWVCTRSEGVVRVRELDEEATARGGEEWKEIVNEPRYDEEDMFSELFKENWPQETPLADEWWRNWTSLPLSSEGDDA